MRVIVDWGVAATVPATADFLKLNSDLGMIAVNRSAHEFRLS